MINLTRVVILSDCTAGPKIVKVFDAGNVVDRETAKVVKKGILIKQDLKSLENMGWRI